MAITVVGHMADWTLLMKVLYGWSVRCGLRLHLFPDNRRKMEALLQAHIGDLVELATCSWYICQRLPFYRSNLMQATKSTLAIAVAPTLSKLLREAIVQEGHDYVVAIVAAVLRNIACCSSIHDHRAVAKCRLVAYRQRPSATKSREVGLIGRHM